MHVLLRNLTLRELITTEAPSLTAALVIAELFYKFHSFTLESLAFLATWFVIGALVRGLASALKLLRQRWQTHMSNSGMPVHDSK